MRTLNTQTVITQFNSMSSSMVSGPNFQINVPSSYVMVPKPLSYSFRVAEFLDADGNVVKVGLQGKIYEHDMYGSPTLLQDWSDIPRVQIDVATGTIL